MPCFFLDLGATRHIKEGDRTGGIPIIALTARAMETDREKALQARCDDYDTKPVEALVGQDRLLGSPRERHDSARPAWRD